MGNLGSTKKNMPPTLWTTLCRIVDSFFGRREQSMLHCFAWLRFALLGKAYLSARSRARPRARSPGCLPARQSARPSVHSSVRPFFKFFKIIKSNYHALHGLARAD